MAPVTSSSASTSNSAAAQTDEEDKHSEEGAEELKVVSPFDRLPDELVLDILEYAGDHALALVPVLLELAVNKRFARLALRLHMQFLDAPPESRTLQKLLTKENEKRQTAARTLEYWGPAADESVRYDCEIIRRLENLKNLTLVYFGAQLPTRFTDALSSLPSLTSLTIDAMGDWTVEDAAFTIGRSLPGLRNLTVCGEWPSHCYPQLFSSPCPNLQSVDLVLCHPYGAAVDNLPFKSLVSARLEFSNCVDQRDADSDEDALWGLIPALETALYPDGDIPTKLASIIACFPSLRELSLGRFFDTAPDHADEAPDSPTFFPHRPNLAALILYLGQHTSVLCFRQGAYRWVRRTPEEEFQVDWYRRI
ncbi:hypothetical protein JCM8097_007516 [Rhodosporidiobolus ruineniae]